MLGLFLQWYMVVFITLSMYTIKTNLFNKFIWAFKGVLLNLQSQVIIYYFDFAIWKWYDLISYSFKKKFFKGRGGAMETPHHKKISPRKHLTTEISQKIDS